MFAGRGQVNFSRLCGFLCTEGIERVFLIFQFFFHAKYSERVPLGSNVGQRPKTGTWSVLAQKQTHSTIKSKSHPASPAICPKRIVPVLGRIKPTYTRFCLLCLTLSCFFSSFLPNQRPSIVPPYAPHTNADVRGDPLHPPQPTPRHTSNTRICLRTSAEKQIRHTDTNLHHDHRRLCVSCIRNRARLDQLYVAGASRGRRGAGYKCNMLLVWRTSAFVYS